MTRTIAALAAAGLALAAPAAAQEQEPGAAAAVPGPVGSAAKALRQAGENALYVGDLLGAEVTGPGESVVGTVENLVAVPGGQLVAIVVVTGEGERVPVPYKAVKVARTTDRLGLTLDVSLEDLKGRSAFSALDRVVSR